MNSPQTEMMMGQERTISDLPVVPLDSKSSHTGSDASDEARRIWGIAVAAASARVHEQKVLSTPGILDALDEAVAEIEAMEDTP
jgi:hypothetical protein